MISVAVCTELEMIANGMIVYNADLISPHEVGTVATYSCNQGYELAGSEMRTCEDTGDGSGSRFNGQAPTCERKQRSAYTVHWHIHSFIPPQQNAPLYQP